MNYSNLNQTKSDFEIEIEKAIAGNHSISGFKVQQRNDSLSIFDEAK